MHGTLKWHHTCRMFAVQMASCNAGVMMSVRSSYCILDVLLVIVMYPHFSQVLIAALLHDLAICACLQLVCMSALSTRLFSKV